MGFCPNEGLEIWGLGLRGFGICGRRSFKNGVEFNLVLGRWDCWSFGSPTPGPLAILGHGIRIIRVILWIV